MLQKSDGILSDHHRSLLYGEFFTAPFVAFLLSDLKDQKSDLIVRECQEELGIALYVERELTYITYEYPDRIVHLRFYLCHVAAGVPEKKEHNALAWITPSEIDQYEFCPADKAMILELKKNGDQTMKGAT